MIEPRYVMLQSLFADRLFRIPMYQRFYSWTSRQCDDLFFDLERLACRSDKMAHFLATVVCLRTEDTRSLGTTKFGVYDVVDGQQRLTTLILLLKCIELDLPPISEEAKDIAKLLVKRDGSLILDQQNNPNQALFSAFLRTGSRPQPADLHTHADRRLANAINECMRFVVQWKTKRPLLALLGLVLHRIGLVVYDTEDRHAVFILFEVLNSRGLPADWLDKTKSLLMGRAFELAPNPQAAAALVLDVQRHWFDIYHHIARADMPGDEVLRVTATLRFGSGLGKPRSAEDSLDRLREACDASDRPVAIAQQLGEVASHLATLHGNTLLGPVTEIFHARLLAVALLSAASLSDQERTLALDQWERLTFRVFCLGGKDSRTKVGDFVRLAARIGADDPDHRTLPQILAALQALGTDHPIGDVVRYCLDGKDCLDYSPEVCRYLLWAYELHLAHAAGETLDPQLQSAIWSRSATEVIHPVFPIAPGDDPAWDGKLRAPDGSEQAPELHTGRIGNLVLLPNPNGFKGREVAFQHKKTRFAEAPLRQLQQVCALPEWDLHQIAEREARIIGFAMQRWADIHPKSD